MTEQQQQPYVLLLPLQLMAHVFNRCWHHAFRLALVCKDFSRMVKRREFWMPAVQREMLLRIPLAPLAIREMVDPFFEFPKHVFLRPRNHHWAQWLFWMFPKLHVNCHIRVVEKHIIVLDYCQTSGTKSLPLWNLLQFYVKADGAPSILIHKYFEGNKDPHFECAKTMYPEPRYTVHLEKRLVWVDSHIEDKYNDSLAMWCGGVETNDTVVPNLKAGHWKDKK